MILGHGDIGTILKEKSVDRPDYLFFASGVSNSQEQRDSEYEREAELLLKQPKGMHLVYFSSLSIFYSNTRYRHHKRYMEWLVRTAFTKFTILRIGNITWGTNPHTLINHFRNIIKSGNKIDPAEIKDEYRYIVTMDEFIHWIKLIPEWNCEMNITGLRLKVKDIITTYGYA